jgi:DNA-binding CsgD family transcriptional regulator
MPNQSRSLRYTGAESRHAKADDHDRRARYLFDDLGNSFRILSEKRPATNAGLIELRVERIAEPPRRPRDSSLAAFTGRERGIASLLGSRATLTPREQQIVVLLASRATNKEIAATLGISAHTARHHTQSVLQKLGLKSRGEVRAFFTREMGDR